MSERTVTFRRPDYAVAGAPVEAVCFRPIPGVPSFYPAAMLGAQAIARRHDVGGYVPMALALTERLDPDDYARYLRRFYADGLARFGAGWAYADIVTVLICLAEVLAPRRYLEVGVRRGRSAAAVASAAPDVEMALFDLWMPDYAGMPNPGPAFVDAELARLGHAGPRRFVDGDSHVTLKAYFAENPGAMFDLITVDGDHSAVGAATDLCDVLPHLKVGGAIVFDDVCHPAHPDLARIWNLLVADDMRFSAHRYTDAGYGVAFAIRKY